MGSQFAYDVRNRACRGHGKLRIDFLLFAQFAYLNRDLEGNVRAVVRSSATFWLIALLLQYVNPNLANDEANGNGEKHYKGTGTNADIEKGAKTDVRGAGVPGQSTFQGPDHPSGENATTAQTDAWARERNLMGNNHAAHHQE